MELFGGVRGYCFRFVVRIEPEDALLVFRLR
jgi:hypothetical protein